MQRASTTQLAPSAVPAVVQDALTSTGEPLDSSARTFMEARFGRDFSHVRVHTGDRAVRSAAAINALAYTVGRDIVFGAGRYAPETSQGRRLLAHELTHVVQQREAFGIVQRQGQPADENHADRELAEVIALMQAFAQTLQQKSLESIEPTGGATSYDRPLRDVQVALENLEALRASGTAEQKLATASQFKTLLARRGALGGATVAVMPQRKTTAWDAPDDPLEREADSVADRVTSQSATRDVPRLLSTRAVGWGTIQRQGGPAEVAIGAGVAAGPPGWVILAVGAGVIALGLGIAYVVSRPRAVPRVRSCATEFPTAILCSSLPPEYIYSSPQAALRALKEQTGDPHLRLVNPSPSTSGPCPLIGTHYGVKSNGDYVASISCCPCCQETGSGPIMTTRCRII